MIEGKGSKFTFSDSYGVWSTDGQRIFDISGGSAFVRDLWGQPTDPTSGLKKTKFGGNALQLSSGSTALTTVEAGIDFEWTIFSFVTIGLNGAPSGCPRYFWAMQNSNGDEMCYGDVGTAIAFATFPFTGAVVSSTNGDIVSLTSNYLLQLADLVILPWCMLTDEADEVFKHTSQWDMRLSLGFENSFKELALDNIAQYTDAASGGWSFVDTEGDAPGSCVLDFGTTNSTDVIYADAANWYAVNGYADDTPFYARPRSISIWIKCTGPTGPGGILVTNIFTRVDDSSGFTKGFVVSAAEVPVSGTRISFGLFGEKSGAQESVALGDTYGTTPGEWTHYLFTLERVKGPTPSTGATIVTLYKNGSSVDTSTIGAGGDALWDADPTGVEWSVGGLQPFLTPNFPANNVMLAETNVYGWHFSADEAMQLYERGRSGFLAEQPRPYAETPHVNLSGTIVNDREQRCSGQSSSSDFVPAYIQNQYPTPATSGTMKVLDAQLEPSKLTVPFRPSDEMMPNDPVKAGSNPFTSLNCPGSEFGTRPVFRVITNGKHYEPTTNGTSGRAWFEGPSEFQLLSRVKNPEGVGPYGFDVAEYFGTNGNAPGGWQLDGDPSPNEDNYGTRMGKLHEGKDAITILMWIRPNPIDIVGINTLMRSSVNVATSSKLRLDLSLSGANLFLRVSGRSDNADSFHTRTGTVDIVPVSANGSWWVMVGGIWDCAGDRLLSIVNDNMEDLGTFGMAQAFFDDSHSVTQIGHGGSTSPARSWIYSTELYTRRLTSQEIADVYHNQVNQFKLRGKGES